MKARQLSSHLWEIPPQNGMRVPARVYWPKGYPVNIHADPAVAQLARLAHLPGIVNFALAMPDIHWGYGFPIGGIAAVDLRTGAVSPGGVGYDINCGVRLLATDLPAESVRAQIGPLVRSVFESVPVGVGANNAIPTLTGKTMDRVLRDGAAWAIENGYAISSTDLECTEDQGRVAGADPRAVSAHARQRGATQLGTLGAGNHFIEIDQVMEVAAGPAAAALGLRAGQVVIQIHSGSRGLGHQVCDDALAGLARAPHRFGKDYAAIPDRQLASAPIHSPEGEQYLSAMRCAANFAWANRQVLAALTLRGIAHGLAIAPEQIKCRLVYDVCHNMAKVEPHAVGGKKRELLVHRKGATRALGPGDPRLPSVYRRVGQPVLVPGDMGRQSFVLVGTRKAEKESLASACHGAGRLLSRKQAVKQSRHRQIQAELHRAGIEVVSRAKRTLAEECSEAYKDVSAVVAPLIEEGILSFVARLRPLGVVKG